MENVLSDFLPLIAKSLQLIQELKPCINTDTLPAQTASLLDEVSNELQNFQLLTDDCRENLLCSALEGGSNYWYQFGKKGCQIVDKYLPKEEDNRTFVNGMMRALKAGESIAVFDIENGEKLGEINRASMQRGEITLMTKHSAHFSDIISNNDDSITADVWFQLAVMNEVLYS